MLVSVSRYTPGLKNGENINFNKGDVVSYRMRNGEEHRIKIDSELMQNSGYYGYEAIFHSDGQRCFAVAKGIYDWDGKVS